MVCDASDVPGAAARRDALCRSPPQEPQPANSLFEDPAAIEKELTEYLTQYVAFVRQMQAQAAAGGD